MREQKKACNMICVLGKICLSGVIALLLLSIFIAVYGYSGVHVQNLTGETDYRWEAGQWKSTMTEGFSWLRMDEEGFNNAYDADEKGGDAPDILLMGGSHMEAVNVGAQQNVGFLLNELLPEYTYNIGMSGHTIYTCIKNIENAVAKYQPSEYVIVETDTVSLSEENMQMVIDGEYAAIPSYDSGLVYMLQKNIPAIKTLYKNMTDWRSQGTTGEAAVAEETVADTDEYADILDAFLKKAVEALDGTDSRLVILYQPQTGIDSLGNFTSDTDADVRTLFEEECQKNGIIFVDVTEEFRELYTQEHRLPHGFRNTSVGNGHLNQYGHQIIAEKLAETIQAEQQGKRDSEEQQ